MLGRTRKKMLPTTDQDLKENTKRPGWGPASLANSALDSASNLLANVTNSLFPFPTEESVAETRKRLAQEEQQVVDPTTGAAFLRN